MYSFLHFLFSGVPIKEFVGLLPKMYSITYDITETDNNVLEKEKKWQREFPNVKSRRHSKMLCTKTICLGKLLQ